MSEIACVLCPVSPNGNIVQNYIVWCHNQDIDMVPSLPSHSHFSGFILLLCVCVYMCMLFHTILSPVYVCISTSTVKTLSSSISISTRIYPIAL